MTNFDPAHRLLIVQHQFGKLFLVLNRDDKVVLSSFRQPSGEFVQLDHHHYLDLVQQYFAGETEALDQIGIQLRVSNFQRSVLQAMRQVKFGQTVSYSELAQRAGFPKAVRAVASTCRRNPLPLIIPCHRVIRHDGQIGQYAFGAELKQQLLTFEAQIIKHR